MADRPPADSGESRGLLHGADSMETPDVTRAQVVALGQAVLAAATLLGVQPRPAVTAAVGALSGALVIVLPAADAAIRRERARNAVAIAKAKKRMRPPSEPLSVLRAELDAIKASSSTDDNRAPAGPNARASATSSPPTS